LGSLYSTRYSRTVVELVVRLIPRACIDVDTKIYERDALMIRWGKIKGGDLAHRCTDFGRAQMLISCIITVLGAASYGAPEQNRSDFV